MQIGMVGLGRMGGNMARRLMRGGHKVVAWARNPKVVQEVAGEGAVGTMTLDDFVAKLAAPRVAWVMVPAGAATEQVVMDLARRLRSEEHTSELQSQSNLVCRLLLEKKK